MVYVISKDGHPLMPTERHGKVRRLLKENKAIEIQRCPFTVQLLYETENITQEVSLGVDAGSKHIGLSATTETKELYAGEVELRSDIAKLLSARREFRSSRRNRKTRYRKPRFDNRSRPEGWIPPSLREKIDSHLKVIADIRKILPISKITIEVAAFDIQKLKADLENLERPKGKDYQQGEQMGFWNAREYVLHRDGHTCQYCKGKSGDKRLNVHHLESRQTGGDAPNNLITLCETCHNAYHDGKIELKIKRGASFRDAVFMGIMRWACYNKLKELYPNVKLTYGYITKNTRIANGLEKSHIIDARCISGNPTAKPAEEIFYIRKVRCHNRQIHKATILKGGKRKLNQTSYNVFGFRLFDKVMFEKKETFIFGRRSSGYFDIRKLDGTKIHAGISYKKLKFLEPKQNYITERRTAIPPRPIEDGVSLPNI